MLRFQTLLMGPERFGRGYHVLERSGARFDDPRVEGRLDDLALMIHSWSKREEPPFALLVPLDEDDGAWFLGRAAYLGRGDRGNVACAQGILIDAEQMAALDRHPERLLDRLSVPDGSLDFARQGLSADPASLPRASPLPGIDPGLAWQDLIVTVDEPAKVEEALAGLLARIEPAEQRARIIGWATCATLEPSDDLVPSRAFQLLVIPQGAAANIGSSYLPARVSKGRVSGIPAAPAPAWQAWQALRAMPAPQTATDAIRALAWATDGAALDAPTLLASAAGTAFRLLDADGRVDLLVAMANEAHRAEQPLSGWFASAVDQAFARLLDDAPQGTNAAYYVQQLVARGGDALTAVPGVARHAARESILPALPADTLSALLRLGLLDELEQGAHAGQLDSLLAEVANEPAKRILDMVTTELRGRPALGGLIVQLLHRLGRDTAWVGRNASGVRKAVEAAMAAPGGLLSGLAHPAIVGVVHATKSKQLKSRFVERCLTEGDPTSVRPFYDWAFAAFAHIDLETSRDAQV
ncbi:MAG: hypothetical protein WDN24_01320 [Sphingomonas sp.]